MMVVIPFAPPPEKFALLDEVLEKRCSRCGLTKPTVEFDRDKNHSDGLVSRCISCRRAAVRARQNTNAAKYDREGPENKSEKKCSGCDTVLATSEFSVSRGTHDGYRSNCKRCDSDREYIRLYGMTLAEKEERIIAQGHKCAIRGCDQHITISTGCIDHCHKTGLIRGIICQPHNRGIGILGDTAAGVMAAHDYLKEFEQRVLEMVYWFGDTVFEVAA